MDFGKVTEPDQIDFSLPADHPDTKRILQSNRTDGMTAFVGCAKWGKKDLKTFYPRGTKDELLYYAQQFNSIELNATFYGRTTVPQVESWKDKTPEGFKFFPKIPQFISHIRRLQDAEDMVEEFCNAVAAFGSRLGTIFLQLPDNFGVKYFDRIENFINTFPKEFRLAIELRNSEFFNVEESAKQLYSLLEEKNITNIITDTAGRRDLLHMRLTTPVAFIRYVGSNHPSDYTRMDEWIERIRIWKDQGLQELYFFVHQNVEEESPALSAYFIRKLNDAVGSDIKIPSVPEPVKA